jgi:hypothetical protein
MHYPQCNGRATGASPSPQADKTGAACLYAAGGPGSASTRPPVPGGTVPGGPGPMPGSR